MLFGSGVILALLLSSMAGRAPGPTAMSTELVSESESGPPPGAWRAARLASRGLPPAAVDLRLRMPDQGRFDLRSLIPKKPPLEVKSMKVVGASGVSIFAPINDEMAAGVGVTAFKIAPGKRALQGVIGLRFKF